MSIDMVLMAPDKIQRVLTNLVDNAINYAESGERVDPSSAWRAGSEPSASTSTTAAPISRRMFCLDCSRAFIAARARGLGARMARAEPAWGWRSPEDSSKRMAGESGRGASKRKARPSVSRCRRSDSKLAKVWRACSLLAIARPSMAYPLGPPIEIGGMIAVMSCLARNEWKILRLSLLDASDACELGFLFARLPPVNVYATLLVGKGAGGWGAEWSDIGSISVKPCTGEPMTSPLLRRAANRFIA